ncbi:MAG: alpha/beta fold hydrolase [Alphaproteobacteria bacterium]|nr:alpha/beta fold hydrolase [Alphaproteobacteria bacterium]
MVDEGLPSTMGKAEARREATTRLFRSVRAGRAWVREAALNQNTPPPAGSIMLKPGDDNVPVFMIPGAPGSVLQLGPIASNVGWPGPVYAIKPRGFEEGEIPFERLEDMADYNIGVIAGIRPNGPYILIGYSVGGLIALEMARRLAAGGNEVPVVVLLDTYPSRQLWPLHLHIAILARHVSKSIWGLRRYRLSRATRYLSDRSQTLRWYLAQCGVRGMRAAPLIPEGASPASRRLHQATVSAGEAYCPARYAGRVVFLQPHDKGNLKPRSPEQVWRRYLPMLEVRRIPGSHLTLVETDAASTGAAIARCVTDALGLPRLIIP